jgi:hypothetical protein
MSCLTGMQASGTLISSLLREGGDLEELEEFGASFALSGHLSEL